MYYYSKLVISLVFYLAIIFALYSIVIKYFDYREIPLELLSELLLLNKGYQNSVFLVSLFRSYLISPSREVRLGQKKGRKVDIFFFASWQLFVNFSRQAFASFSPTW